MKSSSTHFLESFKEAELSVSDDPSSTKGLTPEALCTSADDLVRICSHPLVHGTWIDLGSGYGHTVKFYREAFPGRRAIGIEKEEARIAVAKKLAADGEFIQGDLLHTDIPDGDTYFLYFPQGHVLDRILSELARKNSFSLVVIESHGDLFPRLDKETWFSCRAEIPLQSARHHESARIYVPNSGPRNLSGLHAYSFREFSFLVKDESGEWWGDSYGLFASGDQYLLQHPPRSVRREDVVKIVTTADLPPEAAFLCALRRLPDVTVHTHGKVHDGPLRKIHSSPGFSVEFPSGNRVQWSEIQRIFQGRHLCYESSSRFFSLPPVH